MEYSHPELLKDSILGNMKDRMQKTLMETLGMQIVEFTRQRVTMTMPVTDKTKQPMGLLHGGASVALAESVASMGTMLYCDPETQSAVGIEINANHIRSAREGTVTAIGVPLHAGRTTMVWDIRITDDQDKLICVSRCTVGIINTKK